jgi:hypothetical protein
MQKISSISAYYLLLDSDYLVNISQLNSQLKICLEFTNEVHL